MSDWRAGYFNSYLCPTDIDNLTHNHHWCNVFVPGQQNINVLELVPILVAARYFGHEWSNKHVLCFSDNTQVVSAINKGVSVNKMSMSILRELFWLRVYFNFYITARHIPGSCNIIPDMLSRISRYNSIEHSLLPYMCCR